MFVAAWVRKATGPPWKYGKSLEAAGQEKAGGQAAQHTGQRPSKLARTKEAKDPAEHWMAPWHIAPGMSALAAAMAGGSRHSWRQPAQRSTSNQTAHESPVLLPTVAGNGALGAGFAEQRCRAVPAPCHTAHPALGRSCRWCRRAGRSSLQARRWYMAQEFLEGPAQSCGQLAETSGANNAR